MGGCYTDYGSSSGCSSRSYSEPKEDSWKQSLNKFKGTKDLSELIKANKDYFNSKQKGFFGEVASTFGIGNIDDIPKEFPDTEYEVKFAINLQTDKECSYKNEEPSVKSYLETFDFPVGANARFMKDPIHNIAEGTNHFFGDSLDERLVVIEKAGKTFIKEKGKVVPLDTGVPYEQIVIKRTENRYQSTIDQILGKLKEAAADKDVEYRGKIRKEKGDDFILDTNDGRLYSFTITVAHLIKPDEQKESDIQRQLEIEYAGYIPGFPGFEKSSEKQIVEGMVDLAKYTYTLYGNAPVLCKSGQHSHRMDLQVTDERKYDFIIGAKRKKVELLEKIPALLKSK
jgi:hypothetical protein